MRNLKDLEPGKLYFMLEWGWSKLIIPYDQQTSKALALLLEQGVAAREGWRQGDGCYLTQLLDNGDVIETPMPTIHRGEALMKLHAKSPDVLSVPEVVDDSVENDNDIRF